MKTIGLLGGMSWESSAIYYQLINRAVKHRLGGLHSGKIALLSVDFDEIEQMQRAGDWDGMASILAAAGQSLQAAGAEGLLICTNTMHRVADQVSEAIDIPLLHIADATATAIQQRGFTSVGLLGTAFTMEQDFYRGRLKDSFGIDVLIPEAEDREFVHRSIYQELCLGDFRDSTRESMLAVIDRLAENGAEAVILGCTEIPLLVKAEHCSLPLLDTTSLHATAAVDFMLD